MALIEAPETPLRDVRLHGPLLLLVRIFASVRMLGAIAILVSYFQTWHVVHVTEPVPATATATAPAAATGSAIATATGSATAIATGSATATAPATATATASAPATATATATASAPATATATATATAAASGAGPAAGGAGSAPAQGSSKEAAPWMAGRRETGEVVVHSGWSHHRSILPPLLALVILGLAILLYQRPSLHTGMLSAAGSALLAFLIFRVTFDPWTHAFHRVEPKSAQALFGAAFILLTFGGVVDLLFHPILYMWARRDREASR